MILAQKPGSMAGSVRQVLRSTPQPAHFFGISGDFLPALTESNATW
jgi:hypothetical protein